MSEQTVEPDQARRMLAENEARGIDLRPIEELGQTHAPGAVFVGDGEIGEVVEQVLHGDEVRLILFCEDGAESAEAAKKLTEDGHDAVSVEGGWQAWMSAGLQVQPGEDEEYEGPELKQPGA